MLGPLWGSVLDWLTQRLETLKTRAARCTLFLYLCQSALGPQSVSLLGPSERLNVGWQTQRLSTLHLSQLRGWGQPGHSLNPSLQSCLLPSAAPASATKASWTSLSACIYWHQAFRHCWQQWTSWGILSKRESWYPDLCHTDDRGESMIVQG